MNIVMMNQILWENLEKTEDEQVSDRIKKEIRKDTDVITQDNTDLIDKFEEK